ncbi:MAG TPA: hypothetical protein VFB85_23415, partial [Vicinamibacterales bacterium]|nr:hypothetical protein [Vicinamibacterales bacterium]
AEAVLSMVAPAERAASAVGDLAEDADVRGAFWFWRSVARLALALLARDLVSSALAIGASAALGWFLYMGISMVFASIGYVVLTLAWGLTHVLTHHTGFELLADMMRVRFDWPPIPTSAAYALQAVVFFAVTPFCIGRGSAAIWRGHELTLVILALPIWLAMSVLVPFVGVGVRTAPAMVPVVVAFVLVGLLSARAWPRQLRDC